MKNLIINHDILDVYNFLNTVSFSYNDTARSVDFITKYHTGNCIDYLNYGYTELTKRGYKVRCFVVTMSPKMLNMSKSYVTVELNDKLVLIENIRNDIKGIWEFENEDELINFISSTYLKSRSNRHEYQVMSVYEITPRCLDYESYSEFYGYCHREGRDLTQKYADINNEISIISGDQAKYIRLLETFEKNNEKGVAVNNYANDLLDDNLISIGIKATCVICINKNTKEIVYEYATKYCNNTNWRNDLIQFAKEKKII